MASFRKRSNGWQAQVRRNGYPAISRTFRFKSDAVTWARDQEARIERHDLPIQLSTLKTLRLADLLERYNREITPKKRSAYKEVYRISRLLKHPLAQTKLKDLQSDRLAAFRDERLSVAGTQAVRHDLNLLGHVLKIARTEWGVPLAKNPMDQVRKPSLPKSRDRRLVGDEWQRLIEAAAHGPEYLVPIIKLAVETAMRRGELLNLAWRDIDLENRLIVITQTKNGYDRTIPITYEARGLLGARQGETRTQRVFEISEVALRHAWDRLCNRAGIEDLHFHDLRHEAISRLFEKGLTVPEVALISGHRDYRMLFRYTHLRPEDVAKKL